MKKILVVDDDRQFLKMVTLMLGEAGYVAGSANNGSAALAMLDHHGPWDLVLCDMLMPEQDGIETILAIQARDKSQKIVAMSGGGRYMHAQEVLDSARDFGAREVLFKPFTIPNLLDVLHRVLE